VTERHRQLVAAVTIAWMATVITAAYYVSKPISSLQALAIAHALADMGAVALMGATAGGLGLRLLGAQAPPGRAETIAWSAGLGMGLMALAMLGLGTIGGYRTWLVWLLLFLALLWVRRETWTWLTLVWDLRTRLWPRDRPGQIWQGYLLAIFCLSLPLALLPPTAWDGLVYHLTAPKLYIQAGRLVHPLDLPYLGFPQLGEMLFTAIILLRRPAAAQLVSLLYGGLLALGCYGLAARRWGRPAGAMAACILFSATTIVLILSRPYVDVLLMFYALAAFASVIYAMEHDSPRWAAIAGLLAGMAMSTKYTAVAIPVGLVLVLLTHRHGRGWKPLLFLALAAGAFTAPWLIKNWALTGNPIYPFFLPGRYWDSLRAWWYSRAGTGLASTAPWRIPLAPWYATVLGVEGSAWFDATIGPLYLALPPLALLTQRWQAAERRLLARMALFAAPGYALWLAGISTSALLVQTRLLFPIFPMLVSFVLLLNLLNLGLATVKRRPLENLAGFQSDDDYLTGQLGWHYAVMEAVNDLPDDARVLFLWEPRSFYCRVECWPDALLDRWWHMRQTVGAPDHIAASWRADGFTHLLLFNSGYEMILDQAYDPISPQDQAALATLLAQHTIMQQDFNGAYTLYRLK
jgi:hypothetical protein